MSIKEKVVEYLKNKYNPNAIIIFGSYSDGSFDKSSDIDGLVIADDISEHDSSIIDGIILDIWIYPTLYFKEDYVLDHNILKIFDGDIVLDEKGLAIKLKKRVIDYINKMVPKTNDEIQEELLWCEKLYHRVERLDAEGYYRWHRLLTESVKIYCDIKHIYYYGPKKILLFMKNNDNEAFQLYNKVLKELNISYLREWIDYLNKLHFHNK